MILAVFDRTIDADSTAYVNQLFPAEVFPTNYDENPSQFIRLSNSDDSYYPSNGNIVIHGLDGDDKLGVNNNENGKTFLYGGKGNDLLTENHSDGNSDYYSGGPGNDTLGVYYSENKKLEGGSGNDIKSAWNSSEISMQESIETDTEAFGQYIIHISKPFVSTTKTTLSIDYHSYDGSYFRTVKTSAQHRGTQSNAGIRFYVTSGNLTNLSKISVYGLKQ